jgi:hypothetical protein
MRIHARNQLEMNAADFNGLRTRESELLNQIAADERGATSWSAVSIRGSGGETASFVVNSGSFVDERGWLRRTKDGRANDEGRTSRYNLTVTL